MDDRLKIGGNSPPLARSIAAEEGDFALVVTAFLEDEYAKQPKIVQSLLEEARALMCDPETGKLKKIDDETKGKVTSLIKRMRDTAKALNAWHDKEKQPYLRGGQAVDQFFFGWIDKLTRRDKKNKAGAADVLNDELTDYDTRILEAERERRRLAAAEEARIAQAAYDAAAKAEREAEDARLAAERARKPEIAEQKETVAEQKEAVASEAKVDAALAAGRAQEAHIATLVKPADIMRTRGADGTLSTMATEPFAVVENEALLDRDKLWPFIPLAAKEQAYRAWAKTVGYNQQMAGGTCGRKPKSTVR
jgi:hypothetical protein